MKKTILLLTLILSATLFSKSWVSIDSNTPQDARKRLVSQDSYSNTIHFELDGFWLEKVGSDSEDIFSVDVDEGIPLLEKGSPDLEKLVTSVIIPEDGLMDFEIVDSKYKEYSDVLLAPSKGSLLRNVNPSSIPLEYNDVYNTNDFFPGKLAELSDPYILRDFHGQTLIVYPFQYNPISNILRVYSELTVKVFSNSNAYNQSLLRNSNESNSISSEFAHMYSSHFINYDSEQSRYDILEEHGNMLVISNDAFMSDMASFVEWKNTKGIPTEIVPLSAIGNSSSAIDQYVSNYYYQNGLTFLLLVGDINQVPSISISGTASDPSYGYIEGNDYYSEIMVGRFSAENSAHVQTQVEKVINYERYPSSQSGSYRYGIGIASSEGAGIGDEGESDYQHLDNIRQKLMDYTYIDVNQIYATNGGSSSDVTSAVNDGRSIINYTGHGSNTSWGTTGFSNSNVDALTNTEVWPFIQSVACVNGAFDQGTCFAEAWLRATHNGQPSGAIAMVASTVNQQWAPPMEAQDEFNDILIESYSENIKRTYGGLFYNSTMLMVDSYGSNGQSEASYWHLFGDPSLVVRTDDPQNLTVQHDQTILIGQSEFVVDLGIDGANVALSSNGNLIKSAYSSNGIAVLDIDGLTLTPGVWTLNIAGYNHYNYETDINVIAPEGPYIISGGYEIATESGLDNGMVENGEQISLNLSAENVGVEDAYSVVASITCNDEYIVFENTELDFGNVGAGQTVSNNNLISFGTKHSTPNGHVLQFQINFNSSNNLSWESGFNVVVNAPSLELSGASFDDGNGDGIWDAGENATISVVLSNTGNAANYSYPGAILNSSNPYIEILSNVEHLYGIDSGQSVELSFNVLALDNAPLATTVEFTAIFDELNCQEDCITIDPYNFSMIIGHPTILIWDPIGGVSGNRFVEFLESTGRTGYDYVSGSLTSTDYYTTAFVFLGIFYSPSNHVLTQSEADGFVQILNNGGSVYMEGGDTWAYDSQTSLHGMFGLNGVSDGSSDLGTINGMEGTFTEGMSFTYNGGNDWIDQLAPSGGFTILENNSPNYGTAIAYVNEDMGYKTIGASHELGGLQGDVDNYFEKILEFFETGQGGSVECSAGDLNEDGMNDILDIVAQVNILVQISVPTDYQLCAADINSDGEINVLDVVLNINIIVGGSYSNKGRNYKFASYANIVKSDKDVFLKSDGDIRALQLNVNSDSIVLNDNIEMEFKYNKNSGDLVFYSIDPNKFLGKEVLLFSYLEDEIDIQNVRAVNSASNIVDSDIVKALSPSVFTLNQNYPNPFNPSTSISFEIGTSNNVELSIYDINGREIVNLFSGFLNSGNHSFVWDGKNNLGSQVSSGTYIYRLKSKNKLLSKKMIFMK